jgi:hypothetical protein
MTIKNRPIFRDLPALLFVDVRLTASAHAPVSVCSSKDEALSMLFGKSMSSNATIRSLSQVTAYLKGISWAKGLAKTRVFYVV